MKLYVDDIRNAPNDSWTVCRTVSEAIRVLEAFHFDEVSLDHDISHQVQFGKTSRPFPCPEDFASVALYLAAKYKDKPKEERPRITLHTANPVGAYKMREILSGFDVTEVLSAAANRLEMEV